MLLNIEESLSVQIVKTYGKKAQLKKLAEEFAEASSAIQSWINAVEEDYPVEKINEKLERMYSEVADALFVSDQTPYILDQKKLDARLLKNSNMMLKKIELKRLKGA